ncbi:MAG TPA: UvrB/UvrC motif-containing protein [Nitrososphaeraceae archaeon]|nr:UvrB/UvrC motif-containing protein [Nitrososphaeraceae archaeon]
MITVNKSIHSFKKGDTIVRIQPAKPYREGVRDRSYLGEKLTFIGCANGNIYLEREENATMTKIIGTQELVLTLDVWSEDWDYYIDPKELFAKEVVVNVKYLQSLLDKAVLEENYEEAEKLRKQIEKL